VGDGEPPGQRDRGQTVGHLLGGRNRLVRASGPVGNRDLGPVVGDRELLEHRRQDEDERVEASRARAAREAGY
jgi:hypothetical protein